MLDIDGNMMAENGKSKEHQPIPEDLIAVLKDLHHAGVIIILVTGAPWCLAGKIVKTLKQRGIPVWLAADYGGAIQSPDGRETILVDQRKLHAFNQHRQVLEGKLREFGGLIDDRQTRFQFNAFFNDTATWKAARENWDDWLAETESMDALFTASKRGGQPLLSVKWNESDHSMNVCAGEGSKQRAVDWAHREDMVIIAGGGDSGADEPIAMAVSMLFYVSRRAHGAELNQTLLNAIEITQRGYIAPKDTVHGHGLAIMLRMVCSQVVEIAA